MSREKGLSKKREAGDWNNMKMSQPRRARVDQTSRATVCVN